MKYVMAWTSRLNGSEQDNEDAARRGVELFSKWEAPAGTNFLQFVGRLDGAGGFAVIETDTIDGILDGVSKFGPLNNFELYPVVDVGDWMAAAQDGVAFRESIR
ncbi:DUF3303 domain-containing protein [Mycobacterium sp. MS1601]|uniref:DUF3303 domain-containing protein n=1 Tax=Mycobacterium sp. MS1601 TaxID=1936029 RepID=UPI0009794A28|nr:DUF3303 family protein [Mycobacterium sp. MS1601]AQA04808.1 DUF3303 domain-containing protein [Mycobacterium sp. MS1601]